MEKLLIEILSKLNSIETKIDTLESGQKEIKESVHRIELSQPQDIVALLERMNKTLENKTEVLNKRVFNVETEIERLNRQ
ncbi:hypothetical protein [Bacillus pinisoli]|uniref:hypothetical protein n=1 Tax=Bacillus pinisoli TaxID=2901866 RepID=UPI001FF22A70|nr:hypothetical protein [Bacillus pinisoli]